MGTFSAAAELCSWKCRAAIQAAQAGLSGEQWLMHGWQGWKSPCVCNFTALTQQSKQPKQECPARGQLSSHTWPEPATAIKVEQTLFWICF